MLRFTLSVIICFVVHVGFAQTQLEMNQDAAKKYQKADKELNDVYKQILKEYKSDAAFIKNFKEAQRIWVLFRDAEMKAKYPTREAGYYGSVFPLCWSVYLTELTEERTKTIRTWLTGLEEGDVCNGSVKTKSSKK